MFAFVIRRLLQSVIVMLTVALISFMLFRYVGDPINNMVGQDTTLQDREKLRETLGLNDPPIIQFGRYVLNTVQGDFGYSYQHRRPVEDMIAERMPATLELSILSAVLALVIALPMGVYTGLNRNGVLAKGFMAISLVGISLPPFLVGILLILLFGVILRWLPTFGRGETEMLFGFWSTGLLTTSGLKALIMPAITLALFQMTLIMRLVRSEMLEVLRTDYIKFARARGLTNRAVNFGHALKNTMVPVITITGLQLGSVIAFAIITETVFQWPGMGKMFIEAVLDVDIPVMAAYLCLIAFFFVVINLVVDLLYYVVDPRLRIDKGAAAGHG